MKILRFPVRMNLSRKVSFRLYMSQRIVSYSVRYLYNLLEKIFRIKVLQNVVETMMSLSELRDYTQTHIHTCMSTIRFVFFYTGQLSSFSKKGIEMIRVLLHIELLTKLSSTLKLSVFKFPFYN